ncbi:MAG: type II toxin-antitoxin system HicB family antitoxin [Candidatus Eiseniibacteriota bacterium]
MASFFGVVHKTPGNEYSVRFPDCPGCSAVGSTFTEVELLAAEILQLHLEALDAAGTPPPRPSAMNAVKRNPMSRGGVIIAVPVTARSRPARPAKARLNGAAARSARRTARSAG